MELVDKVLEQIKKDVEAGDMTAIEELLGDVSEKNLRSFLSEEEKEWKIGSQTSSQSSPYSVGATPY